MPSLQAFSWQSRRCRLHTENTRELRTFSVSEETMVITELHCHVIIRSVTTPVTIQNCHSMGSYGSIHRWYLFKMNNIEANVPTCFNCRTKTSHRSSRTFSLLLARMGASANDNRNKSRKPVPEDAPVSVT